MIPLQSSRQVIQAFPIKASTFIGVASDLDVKGYQVVHANEDGTITFDFNGTSKDVSVIAGMDLAIGDGCTKISSTAEIMVS